MPSCYAIEIIDNKFRILSSSNDNKFLPLKIYWKNNKYMNKGNKGIAGIGDNSSYQCIYQNQTYVY